MIRLYRAVSIAEYRQLMQSGRFEIVGSSVEGKYFAESLAAAAEWGIRLFGAGNYRLCRGDHACTCRGALLSVGTIGRNWPCKVRRDMATRRHRIADSRGDSMNDYALAILRWLSVDEGGRQRPPSGLRYVTLAQFQSATDEEMSEPWSLIVEAPEPLDRAGTVTVTLRFLVPEHAPLHYLTPGTHFQLLEGKRKVAVGEIVRREQPEVNRNGAGRAALLESAIHKK